MDTKRGLTIHFTDGTKVSFEFDKQVVDERAVLYKLEKILDKPYLMVEADGALLMFPMNSVKYLQAFPVPKQLPDYAIKAATVVM